MAKSLLLHPDKCSHPKAVEAFKKLQGAQEWARDKMAWDRMKVEEEMQARRRWAYHKYIKSGGPLKAWCEQELSHREEVTAEENSCFQKLLDAWKHELIELTAYNPNGIENGSL